MNLSPTITRVHVNASWGFHILDAGAPPAMMATSMWVCVSFSVAVLFLEVRPAAIRRVRASAVHEAGVITDDVQRSAHPRWLWRLLIAVWTCALYDLVYRTCSCCVLSPHMLARRRLLPLGNSFVWDGLWTEWVNWVRFYIFCTPFATMSAATQPNSCADWKLPLAGALAYDQYPEYAALNLSRPPTPAEVRRYHSVCLASLVITWIAVVALHGQYTLVRRIFSGALLSGTASPDYLVAHEPARVEAEAEGQAMCTHNFTTALDAAEAPGDDSWVDSPEAIAEEARWLQQDEQLGLEQGLGYRVSVSAQITASSTWHILWQCWPSFAAAVYATLYAFVGGLPLLMILLFPAALLVLSVMTMLVPV
ncbi:hypothetical protein NXY56_005710 [Leishmania guyanensis]|uniref:Uncharacterized protein n=1 Tax=Leishmania guyanensis TaxID=5670 RepID=A0A1E1J3M0_LEIGU|nr:hypothetical protein, conserved [Leishmania guyanensis]